MGFVSFAKLASKSMALFDMVLEVFIEEPILDYIMAYLFLYVIVQYFIVFILAWDKRDADGINVVFIGPGSYYFAIKPKSENGCLTRPSLPIQSQL